MRLIAGFVGLGASLLLAWPAVAQVSPARQDRLREMVAQDCGSCHGMTRKGGLGSPLLAEDMARLSSEAVIETILEGRPGTPMPPWKTMLSRDDAAWITAYLMGELK
ncbi:MAG: cytochrome c [Magnetospirillum sp.]|nr:cytochrome c [Magnetospirillum sp.]